MIVPTGSELRAVIFCGKELANTFPEQINNITSVSNILNGKIQTFTAEGNISKNNFVYGKPHAGSYDLLEGESSSVSIDGISYNSRIKQNCIFLSNPLDGAILFNVSRSDDSVSVYKLSFDSSNRKITGAGPSRGYLGGYNIGVGGQSGSPTFYVEKLTDYKFITISAKSYDSAITCTVLTFANDYKSFTTQQATAGTGYRSFRYIHSYFITSSKIVLTAHTESGDHEYTCLCVWNYNDDSVTLSQRQDFSYYQCYVHPADETYFWFNVPSKGKQLLPLSNFTVSDTFTDTNGISATYYANIENTKTLYNNGFYYGIPSALSSYFKSDANSLEVKSYAVDALSYQQGYCTSDESPIYYGFISFTVSSTTYAALTTFPLYFIKNESSVSYGTSIYMTASDLTKNTGCAISADRRYVYANFENKIYTVNASPTVIASQTPYCCGVAVEDGTGTVKCVSGWNV